MTITIDPELEGDLTTEATVVIQVRSAAAPTRLVAALRAACGDIWALGDGASGGPKFVSNVIPIPGGPIVMVDFGSTTEEDARTVPGLIARRLRDAGVLDAEIRLPDPNRGLLRAISGFTPMTQALLRGPLGPPLGDRPANLPGDLLDLAIDWLRREHQPAAALVGVAASVEFPLEFESARSTMAEVLDAEARANLAVSDFRTFVAAAAIECGGFSELALTAAASAPDAGRLAGFLRRQRDLIRHVAPAITWAGVTAEAHFTLYSTHWTDPTPYQPPRPGRPNPHRPGVKQLADILVPDAMWCQILSPGHLDRLGGVPPGAVEVAADRFELTIGEPEQWLPEHPDRAAVQARGRELLAGCLVSTDEADALTRQRRVG
jgi:hypothetical protein